METLNSRKITLIRSVVHNLPRHDAAAYKTAWGKVRELIIAAHPQDIVTLPGDAQSGVNKLTRRVSRGTTLYHCVIHLNFTLWLSLWIKKFIHETNNQAFYRKTVENRFLSTDGKTVRMTAIFRRLPIKIDFNVTKQLTAYNYVCPINF